jgi:chromosomal replication initiator protein
MLKADYRLDRFVTVPENAAAYRSCIAFAEGHVANVPVMFLYGPAGSGKTHLLSAIGNAALARIPEAAVACVAAEAFLNELINSLRNDRFYEFRDKSIR